MKITLLTAGSLLVFTAMAKADNANDFRRQALVRSIVETVSPLGVRLDDQGKLVPSLERKAPEDDAEPVTTYRDLVTTTKWTERRPKFNGALETVAVQAEIWTRAIQTCLDQHTSVLVPRREEPYYIDAPLIVKSGNRLVVEPGTEIRLKPGTNTCMVRNQCVVDGQNGPVAMGVDADSDILIEGGIWTTLATTATESNGNLRGSADSTGQPFGSHGTIMISNARQVVVRNLTIRESRPHGVQIGNCSEFLVENITFEDHRRDGVHLGGPAENGVVRNIRGVTGDDMIALNAWDWKQSNVTFGPIRRILVDNVTAEQASAVRLLAGTKNFGGGTSVDCNISDCVISDIRGMHEIKIYDQPNLEMGRDNDYADPIGQLGNLFFSDIHVGQPCPPLFQIASNVDGIDISNTTLHFDSGAGEGLAFRLVEIGPMSMTYQFDPANPSSWVEVFSPDKDCTVRGISISNVRFAASRGAAERPPALPTTGLIHVRNQKLNPDYPQTTPRGGTGRGMLIPE
jgi:hypothetical protein